jgi:hypothetical protein
MDAFPLPPAKFDFVLVALYNDNSDSKPSEDSLKFWPSDAFVKRIRVFFSKSMKSSRVEV